MMIYNQKYNKPNTIYNNNSISIVTNENCSPPQVAPQDVPQNFPLQYTHHQCEETPEIKKEEEEVVVGGCCGKRKHN
jgi:methionine synthase I (cobalamin-dependent)